VSEVNEYISQAEPAIEAETPILLSSFVHFGEKATKVESVWLIWDRQKYVWLSN
jgi:hypothetical protein